MVELRFETSIRASPERVFSLLADLRGYDRWLPRSQAFQGTTHVSNGPIKLGTTYVEPDSFGVRNGRVAEFEPPTRLSFEQPMTPRIGVMGLVGIRVACTLTPESGPKAGAVRLLRILQLRPRGPVRLAMPFLIPAFRAENQRVLKALKTFAEAEEHGA